MLSCRPMDQPFLAFCRDKHGQTTHHWRWLQPGRIGSTCIRSQFITTWTGGWLRLSHYESILEVARAPFWLFWTILGCSDNVVTEMWLLSWSFVANLVFFEQEHGGLGCSWRCPLSAMEWRFRIHGASPGTSTGCLSFCAGPVGCSFALPEGGVRSRWSLVHTATFSASQHHRAMLWLERDRCDEAILVASRAITYSRDHINGARGWLELSNMLGDYGWACWWDLNSS